MPTPTVLITIRISAEIITTTFRYISFRDGDTVTAILPRSPRRLSPSSCRKGIVALTTTEEVPAITPRIPILDTKPTLHATGTLPAAHGEATTPTILAISTKPLQTGNAGVTIVVTMGTIPQTTTPSTKVVTSIPLITRGSGLFGRYR